MGRGDAARIPVRCLENWKSGDKSPHSKVFARSPGTYNPDFLVSVSGSFKLRIPIMNAGKRCDLLLLAILCLGGATAAAETPPAPKEFDAVLVYPALDDGSIMHWLAISPLHYDVAYLGDSMSADVLEGGGRTSSPPGLGPATCCRSSGGRRCISPAPCKAPRCAICSTCPAGLSSTASPIAALISTAPWTAPGRSSRPAPTTP